MRLSGLPRWVLNPTIGVLIRVRQKRRIHRDTKGESNVKTEAESGEGYLQTSTQRITGRHQKLVKAWNGFSLRPTQGANPANSLILDF